MKTRSDFVSNSSSSSFILSECKLFNHYSVTLSDICNAIDMLGGERFSEHYKSYSLPKDYKKADEELGPGLQNWNQCVPSLDECHLMLGLNEGANCKLFENFLEAIREAYDGSFIYQGTDDEIERSEVPDNVKDVIKDVRAKLEVETARDLLKRKNAKCVFHFDDNYIWDLAGMSEDDASKWKTESYTVYRFFEVLLNKLAEMGKLKLDDREVLCKLYPAYHKNSGETYIKDEKFNAEDLIDESCLHFISHEG